MSSPVPVPFPPLPNPDFIITIFVYFDPERTSQTKLLFSPGPDLTMPQGKSAVVRWVGIKPLGSVHPAPALVPSNSRVVPDDSNDVSKVGLDTNGPVGSLVGGITSAARKSVVTVSVCTINDAGNQIMGDSTIRNKGGGALTSVIAGAMVSPILAGMTLIAILIAGGLAGYFLRQSLG